ncbi:membrane protein [Lacticaseibacillus rhamnosus]|nr:putative integral membrane protein [Lacticaseibacillus rhamnosus LOCK900]ARD33408.1 hypothetical protein BVH57_14000 [Lacticaseibacillus rhamnosus]EHJ23198.1 integral membrane protein [Lacticaseibacillus rhamnosus R0011]EHJ33828.1 hypothetical protein HMPREF0541_00809 [Lacticaseibacillus rhamnosus ATCC 21052]KIX29012.1 membrane protein [Lacticaseibacillus rhamnosus]
MLTENLMTYRELKHKAKEQLKTGTNRRDLMLAYLLPSLLQAAASIVAYLAILAVIQSFGVEKTLTDPNGFQAYYMQSSNNTGTLNTIQSLVNTMLVQGVNFAVLDLVRHQTRVHPFRAVLGLFNGKWFWGSISLWIFTYFLTLIGFSFLVIPGVLLILGWRQAFWVFKDGHEADQRFSSISALIGSWRLMRGFKANLLGLYVSLIGWYLLENLTFHLFDWAINPYLQLVHANYYENRRAYKMAAQA